MRQQEALDQISFMRQLVEDTKLIIASGYPFFILWGVVWVVGYLSQALLGRISETVWLALIAGATVSQFVIIAAFRRRPGWGSTSLTKKLLRINMILVAASILMPLVLDLGDGSAGLWGSGSESLMRLYIPFWIGLIYMVNGVFLGQQMIAIGGWIVLSVIAATFLKGDFQSYWMAGAGGGSLLVTGWLLMRTYKSATRSAS